MVARELHPTPEVHELRDLTRLRVHLKQEVESRAQRCAPDWAGNYAARLARAPGKLFALRRSGP